MMRESNLYSEMHTSKQKGLKLRQWAKNRMPSYLNPEGIYSSHH